MHNHATIKKFVAESRILRSKYVFRVSVATHLTDAFDEEERSSRIRFRKAAILDKINEMRQTPRRESRDMFCQIRQLLFRKLRMFLRMLRTYVCIWRLYGCTI